MTDRTDVAEHFDELSVAFAGLWDFCATEMRWTFFREEFCDGIEPEKLRNTEKLSAFLGQLRSVPVVDQCLLKAGK